MPSMCYEFNNFEMKSMCFRCKPEYTLLNDVRRDSKGVMTGVYGYRCIRKT